MLEINTLEDIEGLDESVSIECKLAQGRDGKGALPKDFWESYSAFANTEGGLSDCRNRLLHKMFQMLGLGERAGSGIAKINQGWTSQGNAFEINDFHEPFVYTLADLSWAAQSLTTQKTTQKISEIQQSILDYLIENPSASRREIAESIGEITQDGIKYHLNILKDSGRIRREGPDRGGRWVVLESTDE